MSEAVPEVLDLVMGVLAQKYPDVKINPDTPVFDHGLADSQVILDIILQVEDRAGMQFRPEFFDLDGPLSPLKLSRAFKAP